MKYLLLLIFIYATPAFSQFDSNSDSDLEGLYDKFETQDTERKEKKQKRASEAKALRLEREYSKLSDLGTLAPFNDIAVIQKRFLPKTGRFEFSGSGVLNTNNQFFSILGAALRGSYFFNEKYGVELSYLFLNSSKRDITKNLNKNQNIATDSLVEAESYMGAAFRWTPVYGKIAWFEKKIIPFDLFFTPGFGMTKTAFGNNESTFSIGMGQQFALSKRSAVRWDFNWNFYSADVRLTNNVEETKSHSDLMLMIGYSFFFPEATYR